MGTMPDEIEIEFPRLYAKQQEAIFSPSRVSVIEASTKAGKTLGCLIWQAHQVLTDGTARNHWWVAPVYPQSAIAYERAKRMIPRKLYEKNDTDMRITFRNSSKWWFKSGEKPDNLYGEDVMSVVIDEASRIREEAWTALQTTTAYTQAPIRIIGNVKGRRNWAYRLGQQAKQADSGMSYHRLTVQDAIDAGILKPAMIGEIQKTMRPEAFRELFYAEPSDDQGNPFGLEAIRRTAKDGVVGEAVAFGVDLAKSVDYTVICGLDVSGAVAYLDRFQADWQTTRERIIAAVGDKLAMVDSTGVGDPIVEDLQRTGGNFLSFKFTQQSKQQLMEGLASSLQRGILAIGTTHRWLIEELECFEYEIVTHNERYTGVRYSAPPGYHDDGVCALALAVKCANEMTGNVPTVSVVVPGAEEYDPEEQWTEL